MYQTFFAITAEYHNASNTTSVLIHPKHLCLARSNPATRRSLLLSIPGHDRNGDAISPVHV